MLPKTHELAEISVAGGSWSHWGSWISGAGKMSRSNNLPGLYCFESYSLVNWHSYGKYPCLIGESTINGNFFNSKLLIFYKLPEGFLKAIPGSRIKPYNIRPLWLEMTRNDGMGVPCFRHGHQPLGSCICQIFDVQDVMDMGWIPFTPFIPWTMDHGSFHIAVMKQHDKHWINLRMILGGFSRNFQVYPLVTVFNIAMV